MASCFINPRASHAPLTDAELATVSLKAARAARAELERWPEFSATPLCSLTSLARASGIAQIHYKDESQRLGIGSFKALGGAYAATLAVRERLARQPGAPAATLTLTCATDGNHGRSVAYGAQRLGCACIVYMHEHAPEEKADAIRALGAVVVRTPGTYDHAVRVARAASSQPNILLIADTSNDPDDPVTSRVMQGYGVMSLEILEQLSSPPTHVFVQAGVGGLAAALAGNFAEAHGAVRPTFVVVEPERAACLYASAVLGRATAVPGSLETAMAMLACGEASPIAWRILEQRADAFMTIDDASAVRWARRLRTGDGGLPAIDVGVSGAAGLAGLQCALEDPETRSTLHLNERSRVLVIGTEVGQKKSAPRRERAV